MIVTLAWKEFREHLGVWITMAFMTIVLGWVMPKLVSQGDQVVESAVALLSIFGMSVAYGVVCGATMFAGEHEGGTLAFLDIFHGRRGQLWFGKAAIGAVLAIAEGLAVALFLWWIGQQPPLWGFGFMIREGFQVPGGIKLPNAAWFAMLPLVTLDACAWGLLGSSLTRRAPMNRTLRSMC